MDCGGDLFIFSGRPRDLGQEGEGRLFRGGFRDALFLVSSEERLESVRLQELAGELVEESRGAVDDNARAGRLASVLRTSLALADPAATSAQTPAWLFSP